MKLAVNAHLSVDDNCQQDIALYPNPSHGYLTIKAEGMHLISVFNLLGQKLYEAQVEADEHVADLSSLHTGLYLLRVETERGVIKQRFTLVR